jgi:hypothetical protein
VANQAFLIAWCPTSNAYSSPQIFHLKNRVQSAERTFENFVSKEKNSPLKTHHHIDAAAQFATF